MRKLPNCQLKKSHSDFILKFFSLFYYYYHLHKRLPTTPPHNVPAGPAHPSVTGKTLNLLMLGDSDTSPDKIETYFLISSA